MAKSEKTTAGPGEASREMSSPDPRGDVSSTTGDKNGTPTAGLDPVREVRPDRNEKLNEQIERATGSARSGVEDRRRDDNRKGNIRDPDPNRPDPEGIPRANP